MSATEHRGWTIICTPNGCVASKDGRELTGPDLASVITQIDEEEDHTPPFGP